MTADQQQSTDLSPEQRAFLGPRQEGGTYAASPRLQYRPTAGQEQYTVLAIDPGTSEYDAAGRRRAPALSVQFGDGRTALYCIAWDDRYDSVVHQPS